MKIKHFFHATFLMLSAIVLLPAQSYAYGVIDRQVTELTPNLTMYTIDFQFGFLNADMWMPIASQKTIKEGNKTSFMVLSAAPLQDDKYFVPMKTKANFTLLVLEEHKVGGSKGIVTVEKLPITIQKKGDRKQIRVFTKEELKDFTVEAPTK